MKIKVDNRIIFKGTLDEWVARPPSEFQDAIKPGAAPAPWMKSIAIALADAVTTNKQVSITVLTHLKSVKRGWSMEVVETT